MVSSIEAQRRTGVRVEVTPGPAHLTAFSMHASPTRLPGLRLQPRDLELLHLIHEHRFARSDHLHALTHPALSLRALQTRLKKLFTHGYVKRLYVPVVLDGEHIPLSHSRQPIYTMTAHGLRLLEESDLVATGGVSSPEERPSVNFLAHHLVVTDCLVALRAASQNHPVTLISGHAEGVLRVQLSAYRREHRLTKAIVPDGVFTLSYAPGGETLTFYLEVVRADVKGGNARLLEKMRRYTELHRQGFFRQVYGHEHIRAVIFATTSTVRAANLSALAKKLIHGRRMFWFGSYQEKCPAGRLSSLFSPERILALPWRTPDGEVVSLLQPHARWDEH